MKITNLHVKTVTNFTKLLPEKEPFFIDCTEDGRRVMWSFIRAKDDVSMWYFLQRESAGYKGLDDVGRYFFKPLAKKVFSADCRAEYAQVEQDEKRVVLRCDGRFTLAREDSLEYDRPTACGALGGDLITVKRAALLACIEGAKNSLKSGGFSLIEAGKEGVVVYASPTALSGTPAGEIGVLSCASCSTSGDFRGTRIYTEKKDFCMLEKVLKSTCAEDVTVHIRRPLSGYECIAFHADDVTFYILGNFSDMHGDFSSRVQAYLVQAPAKKTAKKAPKKAPTLDASTPAADDTTPAEKAPEKQEEKQGENQAEKSPEKLTPAAVEKPEPEPEPEQELEPAPAPVRPMRAIIEDEEAPEKPFEVGTYTTKKGKIKTAIRFIAPPTSAQIEALKKAYYWEYNGRWCGSPRKLPELFKH